MVFRMSGNGGFIGIDRRLADPSSAFAGVSTISQNFLEDTVPQDDLIVWLVSSDLDTTHDDGDAVTTWSNRVDSDNGFTQSWSIKRPIFRDNIVNGQPALEFTDSEWLESQSDIAPENCTIFYVLIQDNADNDRTYLFCYSTANSYNYWSQYYNTGGDQGKFLWRTTGSDYARMFNTDDLRGQWYIGEINWRLGGFSHSFDFFINGDWLKVDYVSDNTSDSMDKWRIGHNRGGSSGYGLDGYVAEYLVYGTRLSEHLRRRVRDYLSKKYSIDLYGGITY